MTAGAGTGEVQYRVIVAKGDERVEGPDDADVVVNVPLSEVQADGFDPVVAYMRGALKATGHTGHLLDVLKSGDATTALARIAANV